MLKNLLVILLLAMLVNSQASTGNRIYFIILIFKIYGIHERDLLILNE